MNLIQHCLLKLGEESGEIATALLSIESLNTGTAALSNRQDIHLEINGLEAVIRKLDRDFDFRFHKFVSLGHENFAAQNVDKDLAFWVMYTAKACLALSKMTSKCIQFGLQEKPNKSNLDNYMLLCNTMRDVFFGIDCLNSFGLGYVPDEQQIKSNLDKIEHYLDDSIDLGCVSNKPVLEKYLPAQSNAVFDEWTYSQEEPLGQSDDETVIESLATSDQFPLFLTPRNQ